MYYYKSIWIRPFCFFFFFLYRHKINIISFRYFPFLSRDAAYLTEEYKNNNTVFRCGVLKRRKLKKKKNGKIFFAVYNIAVRTVF